MPNHGAAREAAAATTRSATKQAMTISMPTQYDFNTIGLETNAPQSELKVCDWMDAKLVVNANPYVVHT